MPALRASLIRSFLLGVVALSAGACVWVVHGTRATPVDVSADSSLIVSPVRAHLIDGSTVRYANGVMIARDTVRGPGIESGITGSDSTLVTLVPLASVATMESFTTQPKVGTSVVVSVLATAVIAVGALALAKAIFGSCPTVYSDSAGTPVLEGEAFSYSIVPLFERRDVFRLGAQPDARGVLSLEVRNEALETHYINHLQLLEVTHGADEVVIPDGANHALVLSGVVHPATVVDRRGRDLRETLASDDHLVFQTDSATLAGATVHDLNDYIDIAMPRPRGADSVAVVSICGTVS